MSISQAPPAMGRDGDSAGIELVRMRRLEGGSPWSRSDEVVWSGSDEVVWNGSDEVVRSGSDEAACSDSDQVVRTGSDEVVREEPLEIQLGPVSLAVVMRTPGHDEELALGFLVTERVVRCPEDVYSIRHCTVAASPEAADNIIRATLAPHVSVDLAALRRNLYASSSCGICGKATIENALAVAAPLDDAAVFDAATIAGLPERMREQQAIFSRTGGLHAAGLFDGAGNLLVVREDIGRHNAVDKVVGWAMHHARTPLAGHLLMVSGRISFEVVQKALAARIPLIAAVSAPSSLAVAMAQAAGMTLVGFLRGQAMNVYANQSRVR